MPQLGRFTHTTANATNGHPVQGASVTIYREGATVNGDQSGTSPLTVNVRHTGKIKASDTVFNNTNTSTTYNVNSVTATTVVLSGFAGTLSLADGDRLVPGNSQPSLYSDDQGGTTTTNPLTTSSVGLASCFVEFGAYDYIVSGGGLTATLYQGMVSGSEAPGQIRYADDFAANSSTGGIQEAVDDLPSAGGMVVLGAGRTYSTSASVWLHSGITLNLNSATIQRASGTITNGSANNSGSVVAVSPKGSNGTLPTSGTAQSNIGIIGPGIIDGNYTAFTSLTNTGINIHGIRADFVDGFNIHNVRVQNVLQDGFRISSCRSFYLDSLYADTVGQWSVSSSRNALSLYNPSSDGSYAKDGVITNFVFKTIGDEALTISDQNGNISISNGVVDGCDFVIEIGGNGTIDTSGLSFSNITAKNILDFPVTINALVGSVCTDMTFDNMNMICHASSHNAGAIFLNAGTANSVSNIHFTDCHFKNLNSLDTTARTWVDFQPGSGATASRVIFANCSFSGKSGSTRTTDTGFNLRGALQNIALSRVLLKDCAGIPLRLHDNTFAATISDIQFDHVIIDTCTSFGVQVDIASEASTIKEVYFSGCVAKDCATQTNNAGFRLLANFAGSTINNIYFNNCRSFKTSGTSHLYGISLTQTAGTLGPIFLNDCDFTGTQTAEILTSGTITQLQCAGNKHGTQSLTAVGNTLTLPSKIAHCSLFLDADGNYSLTSTPTIADGVFDGQRLTLVNVDATPNTIAVSDEAGLAGSNILLDTVWVGGNTLTMNQGDNLTLIWSSGLSAWVQISGANGVA